MELHRFMHRLGLVVAFAAMGVLPAIAQNDDTGTTAEGTAPAAESAQPGTSSTVTPDQLRAFNLPVAAPIGQGWYGAASTTTTNAMMARGNPWSNDMVPVNGAARVAVIAAAPQSAPPVAIAASTSGGQDRLVTGVVQWVVPTDNSNWEIRFTGIDATSPVGGTGVLRAVNGDTGIGSSQFPRAMGYVALYGPADVYHNGQRVATGLPGQIFVTQGIRASDSGRMLDTATVDPQAIQFHAMVQGNIPGSSQNSLYVFWPVATLDLRNLSAPVALLPAEMQVAQQYFGGAGTAAVAGYRGTEAGTTGAIITEISRPLLLVSLRDRFLARSFPTIASGDVDLRVRNDSGVPQGFYIQGPGIDQKTAILAPGEETTMTVHLEPGTYRVASFYRADASQRDFVHWDTITAQ